MTPNLFDIRALIRGGGELASGIARRLRQCQMQVLTIEIAEPTAVRLMVSFAGVALEMLRDGVQIGAGVKVGDVDPCRETEYCDTIYNKARAIGGGVVEAIFHSYQRLKNPAT